MASKAWTLSICFHIPDSVLLLLVCYLSWFSRPSILRPPPFSAELWRVTLVSCAASGEMTESDNIIYIVCGERSQRGSRIYATLGDLPPLPSPGPIHQMVPPPPQCRFTETCPWESAELQECVYLWTHSGAMWAGARQHFAVRAREACV